MTTSSLWVFWIGIVIIAIGVIYIVVHLGGWCGKDKAVVDDNQAPSPILAPSPRGSS
jgi:hypothetical protein